MGVFALVLSTHLFDPTLSQLWHPPPEVLAPQSIHPCIVQLRLHHEVCLLRSCPSATPTTTHHHRIWDTASATCVRTFEDHSEFVAGLDFSTHEAGVLVDCAWDQSVVLRRL